MDYEVPSGYNSSEMDITYSHLENDPSTTNLSDIRNLSLTVKSNNNEKYEKEKDDCYNMFDTWSTENQIDFIEDLLLRMTHYQHGHINTFLKPMLQRDFISALPGKTFDCIMILVGILIDCILI